MAARRLRQLVDFGLMSRPAQATWSRWKGCTLTVRRHPVQFRRASARRQMRHHQRQLSGNAGIRFPPNSASKLSVTDTVISNIGSGTGGGIVINPQSGGSAQVNLERVTVNGNAFGIAADGTGSTGGINMTIADSMIGGNSQDGIIATTPGGGAPIGVMVKNTKSVNNAFGIRSLGPNVTVRVDGSTVIGNGTGLSFCGGGALLTFGNNAVRANGSERRVLRAGRAAIAGKEA